MSIYGPGQTIRCARDRKSYNFSIAQPVKGRDILEGIRRSEGVARAVAESEIWEALKSLARRGIYVEPTSAAAAELPGLLDSGANRAGERVVVELTGAGLKATDKVLEHFFPEGSQE